MARRLLNALERSERRDLLVSEAIQTRKAGRPRKFWALTPLGVEVLKEVPSYVGRHPGVALAERTAADVARKGRGTVRHDLHLTDVTLAVGGKTRYRAS